MYYSSRPHTLTICLFCAAVGIWLEYCSHVIGLGDAQLCREVMSRALRVAGCHTTDGKLIWDLCIEYEQALLSTMQVRGLLCYLILFYLFFLIYSIFSA